MKNLIFTILITSCLFQLGYGQLNDYYNRMDHVFSNIDPSKVTTGLLKEFGIRFNEVEAYDGTTSSTNWVDQTQWQSFYTKKAYPKKLMKHYNTVWARNI